VIGAVRQSARSASISVSSSVTLRRNSACETIQYRHRFVTETIVAIIS
jgi:hypothetical protein